MVLDAALELWQVKGFERTSMRDISRRLKTSLNELYRHFPEKEYIVLAHYKVLNDRAICEFRENDKGGSAGEKLVQLLETKLRILEPHRQAMKSILQAAINPESKLSPLNSVSQTIRENNTNLFNEWLQDTEQESQTQRLQTATTLWLLNLATLGYWLHDNSKDATNTFRLINKLSAAIDLIPLISISPDGRELIELLNALVPTPLSSSAVPIERTDSRQKSRPVDVVVVGGGPIGMLYASWVKQMRPESSVVVLEKKETPAHKIGESTLSGFCKALRSVGIPHDALQTLFYKKNGLGFFHTSPDNQHLTDADEYILETFDETFQVERRPLDTLVIANARRLGVEVLQGAELLFDRSRIGANDELNKITYQIGKREYHLTAPLVVDASGPAGAVGQRVTNYTDAELPFQTSAIWAYFDGVKRLDKYNWPRKAQFARDEYTQHICFPEGWLWYIPLITWQDAPTANLDSMLDHVLNNGSESREDLESRFGCPSAEITSVGLVLRNDRDDRFADDPRAAFDHYRKKYPAINELLNGSELLEDHYGIGHAYSARRNIRRYAEQVCGDGWLLIGDAAFFVDPLISPGLTGGVATAYRAAVDTVSALRRGTYTKESFVDYAKFTRRLHEALERDNQLVYMSFNHPEALKLVQRFQEIDARRHFEEHESTDYCMDDTNVWGILDDDYQVIQNKLWHLMREYEKDLGDEIPLHDQSPDDYEQLVTAMQSLLENRLQEHLELTPFVTQNTC
jgi:flavin-dependent dehydrogenase